MKKVQTLNEEIQKMRKLMSFNINENSHDSLSEENFNKSTEGKNTDPEEGECDRVYGGPPEVSFQMSNQLNDLLEKQLNVIEPQIKVKVVATGPENIFFKIGDVELPLSKTSKGVYMFKVTDRYIPFSTDISVSLVREELLKDRCFRLLYDRYDSIKNQIDNETIKMRLIPEGSTPISFKMMVIGNKRDLKRTIKQSVNGAKLVKLEDITLLSFNRRFFIKLNDNLYGEIESSFKVKLTKIQINGADIPKSWGEPDPNKTDPEPTKCFCNDVETGEQITYECGSPLPERCKDGEIVFDFAVEAIKNFPIDEAVLTQEAKDIIDENIVKIWNPIPQYRKEEYLEFLEDKTIVVNAYASIDALSNFPDGGRYAGCSKYGLGKGPRVKYNQCLSEARAKAVVEYLKTIANGAFKDVNFVAVGKGETNQWSGLVWNQPETKIKDGVPQNVKSPYSNEETRPDRRFEIKFPAYHKEE
jgi:outer membrane protein OmpA-like peptidoglycan-associated protein